MNIFIPSFIYEAPPFPEFIVVLEEIANVDPTPVKAVRTRTRGQKIAMALAVLGLVFLAISYGPSIYYSVSGSERVSNLLFKTATGKELSPEKKYTYQPPFDRNLPETNSISIPSIGLTATIEEATNEDFETALKSGVWRVNDFGTPYNREVPTILAAHRYGYLGWSLDFRLHNSFYNLPKLKTGETFEVVWRQRKYVYAVYKEETSDKISDYSADMILYTCEDLSSEQRVIKYAKLLEV